MKLPPPSSVSPAEPTTPSGQGPLWAGLATALGRSTERRFFLAAFIGLCLVLGGGGWFYRSQEQQARLEIEGNLASVAQLKTEQVWQWRQEKLRDAGVLTASVFLSAAVAQWLDEPRKDREEKILAAFRAWAEFYQCRDLGLVDARGRVLLSLRATLADLPAETAQAVAMACRTRRPQLTDLRLGSNDLSPCIEAVTPLFGVTQAEPIGAVVLQFEAAASLYPLISSWPGISRTAESVLVRQQGNEVLFLNELRHRKESALRFRLPVSQPGLPAARTVLGQRGLMTGLDYRGTRVLSVLNAIPESSWFLVTKIDEAEALSVWRLRARLIMVVLALLVGALGGTLGLVWQQRSKYLILEQSAAALAERERRLREAQGLNETLVSAATMGILAYTEEGRCVLANEAAARTIGATPADMRAQNFRRLPSWETAGLLAAADGVLATGEARRLEACMITSFGREVCLDAALVRFESDGRAHLLLTFSDTTEQRQLLTELERSNKELELFAYVASHDLQEPLRLVSAYTQLLLQRYRDKLDAEAEPLIQFITEGVTRMQRLIQDLLAYSRVSSSTKPLLPVQSGQALEAALENLALTIREQQAVITHDPLPEVLGDRTQLVQLFQNLLGNALKFRRDLPPAIHVGVGRDPETAAWRFSVRDNGIGIEPAYFDRIFVIFQRLHGRRKYSGTGIGLAICKRIVERHQGRIWVESEPGRGTTFLFTLPIHSTHP